MIVQPTLDQTRHVKRKRTYSGPGFGPRSFECLGLNGLSLGIGSFGASGPATPISILGAAATKLWLRADLGVSALGTGGATIVDQSGNWGANFVQATVANQASLAVDGTIGQLAFTHDGVNDTWNSTGIFPFQISTPYAMIIVAKIPSYAAASKPLIGGDSYQPALATQSGSTFGPQAGALGPTVAGQTAWKRIICELTNSNSDRVQQGSVSATGATSGPSTGANSYIGGIPTSGVYLACSWAEIIVVRPIPVSYTAIDAYISTRYNPSLLT
jgi:hypothetical protein